MSTALKLRNPALGRFRTIRTPKTPVLLAMLETHRPSFCCKDKNFTTLSRKPACPHVSNKFLLTIHRIPQSFHVLAIQNAQVLCPHESCILLPETDNKLAINYKTECQVVIVLRRKTSHSHSDHSHPTVTALWTRPSISQVPARGETQRRSGALLQIRRGEVGVGAKPRNPGREPLWLRRLFQASVPLPQHGLSPCYRSMFC